MKTVSKKASGLSFIETVGGFSVLSDTVFLPKLTAFTELASLKEAEDNIKLLGNVAFSGKSILTHGTIHGREYLFFHSPNGLFDSNRIYDNKLDSLSFFSYEGFRLVVLLAREINPMFKIKGDIENFFNSPQLQDKKPRLILIFESEKIRMNREILWGHLSNIFTEAEVAFFLGEDILDIKQKEGTMLLC